jgi:hypothetical protein
MAYPIRTSPKSIYVAPCVFLALFVLSVTCGIDKVSAQPGPPPGGAGGVRGQGKPAFGAPGGPAGRPGPGGGAPGKAGGAAGLPGPLQQRLGGKLNAQQTAKLEKLTSDKNFEFAKQQKEFSKKISEATGTNEDDAKKLVDNEDFSSLEGTLTTKVEAYAKKKLTPEQQEKLKAAYAQRKEVVAKLRAKYVTEISELTGLSEEELNSMVPNF